MMMMGSTSFFAVMMLQLLACSLVGGGVGSRADEGVRRARKDGLWDEDCEEAYRWISQESWSVGDVVSKHYRGDGVIFSAAGDRDFVQREVLPAGRRLKRLNVQIRTLLYVEEGLRDVVESSGELFDSVEELRLDRMAGPPGFRVKAFKIAAMAASPFERSIFLDFDSVPCFPNFASRLFEILGDGDVALADNYAGQLGDMKRERASGCVVLRTSAEGVRALLARYAAVHRRLKNTRRGRRDQPALMVALRFGVVEESSLALRSIPHDVFCRKNTSELVACGPESSCVVAHKPSRYDLGAKVFGIGFKKTGTTTLAAALETLKIGPEPPHRDSTAATFALLSNRKDPLPAVKIAQNYRSFSDAPWCMAANTPLLSLLSDAYPRAKFVLTVRSSQAWWISTRNWLACLKPFNAHRYAAMLGASNLTRADFVRAYENYNENAVAHFRHQPHRLLVIRFDQSTVFPWRQLCDFVESWGHCPTETSTRKNSFLRNEFHEKHPQDTPHQDALARCAATLADDDLSLFTALHQTRQSSSTAISTRLANKIMERRSNRTRIS